MLFSPDSVDLRVELAATRAGWATPASARPAIKALTLISLNSGRSAGVMPPVIDSSGRCRRALACAPDPPPPLLPAGLGIASAMVNRLMDAGTVPGAGVIQRPVAEQLHLNLTAAGLGHGVAFLDRGERRGADDGHPVGASAKACCARVSPASATSSRRR